MGGGPLRSYPPSDDPDDPATQRWHWRQARRRAQMRTVHALTREGWSQRAIARRTGHHRQTIKRWLQQPEPPAGTSELPKEVPPVRKARQTRGRQAWRAKQAEAHALRQEGRSFSEIARRLGVHRVTISKWLQEDPPMQDDVPVAPSSPTSAYRAPPPPAPWKTWDEVRQVREMLKEHRFLLLRRPERLSQEDQELVEALLNSSAGPQLQTAHSFVLDWYGLWTDEEGQRRPLDEARSRYVAWRANPDYSKIPALKQVLDRMTETKFGQISQFLRNPTWEATNNGAERAGRAFRHRQAPHFNLRKTTTIENELVVSACLHMRASQEPAVGPFHTCQRGRRRRQTEVVPARPP
jgi:transposase